MFGQGAAAAAGRRAAPGPPAGGRRAARPTPAPDGRWAAFSGGEARAVGSRSTRRRRRPRGPRWSTRCRTPEPARAEAAAGRAGAGARSRTPEPARTRTPDAPRPRPSRKRKRRAGAPSRSPEPEPEPEQTRSEHPLASYLLRVNGTERPVTDAWLGESLLYVLRERLGLAGAKDGCEQGECGACSVQVDGRLVASCLVPAATAAGSEVRTVEGLSADGRLSDVQQALVECGAVQCGFCIPGMAMTVHDLLEGNHRPTDLETRQALSGNLCRCSGYRGVIDAVRQVVAARDADGAADRRRTPQSGPAPRRPPYDPPAAPPPRAEPAPGPAARRAARRRRRTGRAARAHGGRRR